MTESVAISVPAEERGRLDIHDGVVETIASRAAATVSPIRHPSGLSRLTSGELPRARVTVVAGRVDIALVVAAHWPTPAGALARRVQETVTRQVGELTGLSVTRVDVEVHCIPSADGSEHRRVQ